MALILFFIVTPAFSVLIQPIAAYLSRKHEFEADRYAVQHSAATAVVSGLVKLYKENANTLTPDHLYAAFHYSHPPAPVRIAALQNAG